MTATLVAITNAALVSLWASGVGVVKVEYDLDPSRLVQAKRVAVQFADDTNTGERVVASYGGSGYDRGHLAPAADFAGQPALPFTYLASNLTPMSPAFNRGEWAQVEREAREAASRLGVTVRVTTVPVYGGTNRVGGVAVPTAVLKTLSTNGVTVAAWLKEQEQARMEKRP